MSFFEHALVIFVHDLRAEIDQLRQESKRLGRPTSSGAPVKKLPRVTPGGRLGASDIGADASRSRTGPDSAPAGEELSDQSA